MGNHKPSGELRKRMGIIACRLFLRESNSRNTARVDCRAQPRRVAATNRCATAVASNVAVRKMTTTSTTATTNSTTSDNTVAAPTSFNVGDEVGLWQRKAQVVLHGTIASFDEATKKFKVDYSNGTSVTVSAKWLEERIAEASNAPTVSADTLQARKAATFARLQQRHEERRALAEARKQAEEAKADPTEKPAVFWAEFNAKLEKAESMITTCVETHTKKLKRSAAKKEISAISGILMLQFVLALGPCMIDDAITSFFPCLQKQLVKLQNCWLMLLAFFQNTTAARLR